MGAAFGAPRSDTKFAGLYNHHLTIEKRAMGVNDRSMQSAASRQAFPKIIRKSTFTKLKKACLKARLPQLFSLVEWLEGTSVMLIRREKVVTLVEFIFLALSKGPDYIRTQHLNPEYYQKWLRKKEWPYCQALARRAKQFDYNPTISLIFTVQSPDLIWLQPCLLSVINQWYPHWEVYLFGLGSAPERILDRLISWPPGRDSRIHLAEEKGFSSLEEAINETLVTITGEFVVFPASKDLLAPAALFEVIKLLNLHPEADIIYADEDTIDSAGKRISPFFKPDWSPDLALSLPYTGRLTVYRRELVEALGGVRAELLPAEHYDLLLRMMDQTPPEKIHHIPKILYHQREKTPQTRPDQEELEVVASRQALRDHLRRTSQVGKVLAGDYPGTYRVTRELKEGESVSIIIPFKDNLALLSQCLTSIFQRTDYQWFEIILINNQSQEKATYDYLEQLVHHSKVNLIHFEKPFNYAAMNNLAVEQARYQYVLFLNNDTEVISSEWLGAMVEHIQRDEVGAVGAKLLFPDHTIQHGGLALGGGGLLCGDYFRGTPEWAAVSHGLSQVIRNCSAVTGACLLTKKKLFQAVGGFDEMNLSVGYNDVDLCLKYRERGYLIVWTPYAKLYHYESASRGKNLDAADFDRLWREQKYFEAKWPQYLEHDPYYNQNLSRLFDGYAY